MRGLKRQREHISQQAAWGTARAGHCRDDAKATRLDAFLAAAAGVGHEHPAILPAHRAKMAGFDARGIGAVTANVRQLILTETRTRHCHARASMARPARRHARPAIDAFAQIPNKDFSHRL